MRHITWLEVQAEAERIAKTWRGRCDNVYGIPQGGAPLAVMVAYILGVPLAPEAIIGMNTLVVDDLVDSGKTLKRYFGKHHVDAAFRKSHSPTHYAPDATCIDDWLSFPWEKNDGAPTDGIVRLLEYIGENPERDGLRDTPERVLKAMKEMTVGYNTDIAQLLSVSFDVDLMNWLLCAMCRSTACASTTCCRSLALQLLATSQENALWVCLNWRDWLMRMPNAYRYKSA